MRDRLRIRARAKAIARARVYARDGLSTYESRERTVHRPADMLSLVANREAVRVRARAIVGLLLGLGLGPLLGLGLGLRLGLRQGLDLG